MTNFFYSRLAITYIKNNKRMVYPYLLSSMFITSIFYILMSLANNDKLIELKGYRVITQVLQFGTYVIALFSIVFLFYTYSFLIKKRIKELGVYAVLGMTKKQIVKIVAIETVILGFTNIVTGILAGIVLEKLAYLCLVNMLQGDVKLGFNISLSAIILTIAIYGLIYLLLLITTTIKIVRLNVIGLLREEKVGEKEPKSRWFLGLIGIGLIAYGYYTSITITSPIKAIFDFFYAVIAVIVGTYLLFVASSIFILKILKNNKNFYYKTKNFINVSSMLYRMKRNAVGIANICILSTMVLVTLGSTSSLYAGSEKLITEFYPRDVVGEVYSATDQSIENIDNYVNNTLKKVGENAKNKIVYTYLSTQGEKIDGGLAVTSTKISASNLDKMATVIIVRLEDYNRNNNANETLADGEILFRDFSKESGKKTFKLQGEEFKIKKEIPKIEYVASQLANVTDTYYVVVKDDKQLDALAEKITSIQQQGMMQNGITQKSVYYAFDLENPKENVAKVKEKLEKINTQEVESSVEVKKAEESSEGSSTTFLNREYVYFNFKEEGGKEVRSFYASFLFIGIFISLAFITSQVMIMYYKQITEGYDDKERFSIMQKVGLEEKEIKQTIRSQVLLMFFAPLIVAVTHVLAAYPVIEKILKLFSLNNSHIFIISMSITILVFIIFYTIVYSITSKIYYKIVSGN